MIYINEGQRFRLLPESLAVATSRPWIGGSDAMKCYTVRQLLRIKADAARGAAGYNSHPVDQEYYEKLALAYESAAINCLDADILNGTLHL